MSKIKLSVRIPKVLLKKISRRKAFNQKLIGNFES